MHNPPKNNMGEDSIRYQSVAEPFVRMCICLCLSGGTFLCKFAYRGWQKPHGPHKDRQRTSPCVKRLWTYRMNIASVYRTLAHSRLLFSQNTPAYSMKTIDKWQDEGQHAPSHQSMHEHTGRFNHTSRQMGLKLAYACRRKAEGIFDFPEAVGINAFSTWFGGLVRF